MKRTDIRAGVVYAVKSSYGPPSPIVFLEDGAAGLYTRGDYGRGPIRKLDENSYTKAKTGKGFSDSDRGYAAIRRSGAHDISNAEAAERMRSADPAAELARFLADEDTSAAGLGFVIVTSLGQIGGLYDEELAAYEAGQQAERERRDRRDTEAAAIRARAVSIRDGLAEAGIGASIVSTDSGGSISLRLDEAEKLIALLRDREA